MEKPVTRRHPVLCSAAERTAYARHIRAQRRLERAARAALAMLDSIRRYPQPNGLPIEEQARVGKAQALLTGALWTAQDAKAFALGVAIGEARRSR